MDFVFWIILIVLIVGVVWWLLNRSNSSNATGGGGRTGATPAEGIRADGALAGGSAAASADAVGTAGIPTAAGFGRPSEPVPPTTADEDISGPAGPSDAGHVAERDSAVPERTEAEPALSPAPAPVPAETTDAPEAPAPAEPVAAQAPAGNADEVTTAPAPAQNMDNQAEWETQWSEAGGSAAPHATAATTAPARAADTGTAGTAEAADTHAAAPIHHPEYTGPHSPTLPGAESAAAEAGSDEPGAAGPAEPSAAEPSAVESSAVDFETVPEPAGHLAADRPYGEGSASPSPDGSGPADYTVKGDAGSMVYYEEGHPEYEQTRAGVWFESPAHAEAAGFRAPRRTRLQ